MTKPRWPTNQLFFPGRMKPKRDPYVDNDIAHPWSPRPGMHTITAADNLLSGRPLTPRRRAHLLKQKRQQY